MKYKMAIPNDEIYSKIFKNIDKVAKETNIQIFKVSEKECQRLMLENKVDAAFLTPLGYGIGYRHADYRIVPGPILASTAFTQIASIFFNPGLKEIKTVAVENRDFLNIIGQLILSEKLDSKLELIEETGIREELLKKFDAVLVRGGAGENDTALDLSEEWYMSYELPLPLGMWVVRNEEEPKNIENLIKLIADVDLQPDNFKEIYEGIEERKGSLLYQFSEEFTESLDHTLQLLYFYQLLDDVAGLKIYGQKSELEGTDLEEVK